MLIISGLMVEGIMNYSLQNMMTCSCVSNGLNLAFLVSFLISMSLSFLFFFFTRYFSSVFLEISATVFWFCLT